jgi:hypothetical protein
MTEYYQLVSRYPNIGLAIFEYQHSDRLVEIRIFFNTEVSTC